MESIDPDRVIKTEPVDSFEWEKHQNAQGNEYVGCKKNEYKPDVCLSSGVHSYGNSDASESQGIASEHSDTDSLMREHVMKFGSKKSNYLGSLENFTSHISLEKHDKSSPRKSCLRSHYVNDADACAEGFSGIECIKQHDSLSACVEGFMHGNPPLDSGEYKPAGEELDSCSRNVSKSNSVTSTTCEATLGKTLANSLKLISTNELPVSQSPSNNSHIPSASPSPNVRDSPHLSPRENLRDYVPFRVDTVSSESISPVMVLSPVIPPRRYRTRSASVDERKAAKMEKKRKVKKNKKQSKATNVTPDGSVTLFQCEECYKVFNRKQTLRQHFITHTDRFACPYCRVRCKSRGDLRTHIQTHTKEKPYHCDVCNTNYTRESILRKHQNTQTHKKACMARENRPHAKKESGSVRKNVLSNRANQPSPAKATFKLKGFSCSDCSRVFLSHQDMRRHKKAHSMKHKCPICHKRCSSEILLSLHMRGHNKRSRLLCKVCSRSFVNVFLLREHTKSHKSSHHEDKAAEKLLKAAIKKHNKGITSNTSKATERLHEKQSGKSLKMSKWTCLVCNKAYCNKKSLENHEQSHHNYSCSICEKCYPTLSKLKVHMKLHGKPYKCDSCDAPFFNHFEFQDHVQKHHPSDEGSKCKICYKEFDNVSDLQFHMQNHAPTMLFSGGCLEESNVPMSNKGKKSLSDFSSLKLSGSDNSIGEENLRSKRNRRNEESDDDSILDSAEFLNLIRCAVTEVSKGTINDEKDDGYDDDDDEVSEDGACDSDVELFSGIQSILQSELLSSVDEGDSEPQLALKKPLIYSAEELISKNLAIFDAYSETRIEENIFKCNLCDIVYDENKNLRQHFLSHVCEYCNTFYEKKGDLCAHKADHTNTLMNKIKAEADRLLYYGPKLRSFNMDSTDSEMDDNDGFLSEMENALDCKGSKTPLVTVLHSLSHDEIVKTNKRTFEKYSCIDATNNIFACTICKRKYARPTTLTRHFKTHVCPFCNKFFEDKADLLEHKYKHRKEASLVRSDSIIDRKKVPSSPMVSKANREMFKKFSFVDPQRNLNRCTLCCKNFVRRTVLTRHMKTHVCSYCDKFYEDKYDLAKHLVTHRTDMYFSDGEPEVFTEYDEEDDVKPFSGNSSLGGDGKMVSLPSQFSSDLPHFDTSFHDQTSVGGDENQTLTFIQIPESENAEAPGNQLYTAQTPVGSTFQIISEPDSGQESFLVASTPGPSVESGKMITISQPQMVAEADQNRQRLYECGECAKRFYKRGHLKSHMLVHTGDKPYECHLCGKAFSRATSLRKHQKTHMKRCKICDTSFTYKYELDLHMDIHQTYGFFK